MEKLNGSEKYEFEGAEMSKSTSLRRWDVQNNEFTALRCPEVRVWERWHFPTEEAHIKSQSIDDSTLQTWKMRNKLYFKRN